MYWLHFFSVMDDSIPEPQSILHDSGPLSAFANIRDERKCVPKTTAIIRKWPQNYGRSGIPLGFTTNSMAGNAIAAHKDQLWIFSPTRVYRIDRSGKVTFEMPLSAHLVDKTDRLYWCSRDDYLCTWGDNGEVISSKLSIRVNYITYWKGLLVTCPHSSTVASVWKGDVTEALWVTDPKFTITKLGVWSDYLCTGHYNGTLHLWKNFGDLSASMTGHRTSITSLLQYHGLLYSGSKNGTVVRWNVMTGEILTMMMHFDKVTDMLIYREELYSASIDRTIIRWNSKGDGIQIIQSIKSVESLTVWGGALISGDSLGITQWTEPAEWNISNHRMFSDETRMYIRYLLCMAFIKREDEECIIRRLHRDIVFVLCQFIPARFEQQERECRKKQRKLSDGSLAKKTVIEVSFE